MTAARNGLIFASTYWHVDCVRKMSLDMPHRPLSKLVQTYPEYNFSQSKAEEIYGKAKELVPVLKRMPLQKHYQASCRPAIVSLQLLSHYALS